MNREQALTLEKVYVDERGFIHVDNAVITSKNFAGVEIRHPRNPKKIVNSEGNRNFSLELTQEAAELLSAYRVSNEPDKAFKVQVSVPDDDAEDQTPRIFLTVKLKYRYDDKGKPFRSNPKVRQYSKNGMTEKTEKNIDTVDEVYIEKADLIFSPYPYDVNGNIGLSAYLTQLNYKIKENDLNSKWDQDYITDSPEDFEEEPFC